jgi:hypothetical protein
VRGEEGQTIKGQQRRREKTERGRERGTIGTNYSVYQVRPASECTWLFVWSTDPDVDDWAGGGRDARGC